MTTPQQPSNAHQHQGSPGQQGYPAQPGLQHQQPPAPQPGPQAQYQGSPSAAQAPAGTASTGPKRAGNPLALVSVLLVAGALALNLIESIVQSVLWYGYLHGGVEYQSAAEIGAVTGIVSGISMFLEAALAITAIVLGALAARSGQRPVLAGIGIGGGAVLIAGLFITLVSLISRL